MGILGVILGIVAVLLAVLATFLFGTTGMIIAVAVAAVAILLAFLKRKKDKKGGIAAIVIGVLAIILAFSMNNVWSKAFTELRTKAIAVKPDGLWASVSDDTSGGLMGIISKLPKDETSMNALIEEMNELNKISEAQQ